MPDPVLTQDTGLLIYGPLGIGWSITIAALIWVYRDLQKERAARAADAERAAEEQAKLNERYIAKAETWMDKHKDLAESALEVVESAVKKRNGNGGTS